MDTKTLCTAAILALSALAAQALQITSASPQGEVAQVRQAVLRFDADAVRFGDARARAPATVTCSDSQAGRGTGRWNSAREWVWQFQDDLPPGVRCTVAAASGFQSPQGEALSGRTSFTFHTGGPFVRSTRPYGGRIDEDQFFVLRLNGPATLASVQANVWCSVEGLGERVPVRLVEGAERDALLKARRLQDEAAKAPLAVQTLACNRRLPPSAQVQLVYGQGVATPSGIANTVEKRFTFQVREPFTASFSCERENANAACLPIRPMRVAFNAPVPRALAAAIRLKSGSRSIAPAFDAQDQASHVNSVQFAPPFAEGAAYTVELPPDFQDDAARPLRNADSFPLAVATGPMPPLAKFAAAPFGIVERFAEADGPPLLPVTLRNVEAQLPLSAKAIAPDARVADLRPESDADILAWFRKVQRYDRFTVDRKRAAAELKAPLPRVVDRDQKDWVQSRMLTLLAGQAGVRSIALPQSGADDPRPFEVVGIPLTPGFHVLEISSKRLGAALLDERYGPDRTMVVRSAALVTNLGVHFKLGRENALAWVTTLDKGMPVAGARVAVSDCRGRPVASGTTDAQGVLQLAGLSPQPPECNDEDDGQYAAPSWFVTARARDAQGVEDMAFTFSDWNRGIEPWRFNLPISQGPAPDLRAHTVFDRTLLRAGETLAMKHLLRTETAKGLALPTQYPGSLTITHVGSGQQFTQALPWRRTDTGGQSAESRFTLPPAAKLGVYEVAMVMGTGNDARSLPSGQFRVEEFRLPVLEGRIAPADARPLVQPASVPTNVQVNYVAGGGAANLPVRVSALLRDQALQFDGFDAFSFTPPRDRKANPSNEDEEESDAAAGPRVIADKLPLNLDATGAGKLSIDKIPTAPRAQQLLLEATYADPNGEVQTLRSTSTVWPAGVVAGIKTEGWVSNAQKIRFQALALDLAGKPRAGVALDVQAFARIVTTSRKRMVGGFYTYDNQSTGKDLGSVCSGKSDARGLLLCEAKLTEPGEVELVVTAKDEAGRAVQAASSVYLTRQGELWFGGDNHDRIDLLPEKRDYAPGETARLQVRMPFRYATALVTVEREGVLLHRVVQLNGQDPTLELMVEAGWGPNVYVSALVLRGRLRDVPWYSFFTWGFKAPREWWSAFWHDGKDYVAPSALVDLSKPAFRLGVAELRVGTQAHRIDVKVTPDQPTYAVRGQARVTIQATLPDGKPAAHGEVALVAVDQALLELMPNDSWNLLAAMLQRRAWGVETSTAQMEIIGRRHYGRKAVPAGGGGGRGATRELLDTLLLWEPRVALDANGQAQVTVPLNDALTTFRIVAVADARVALFGTGQASIRTTQDLQIISGLPPLVREDDQFRAQITLRNTTAKAMKVEVTPRATLLGSAGTGTGTGTASATASANTALASASAAASASAPGRTPTASAPSAAGSAAPAAATVGITLATQTVEIPPGEAREVTWDVTVPAPLAQARAEALRWEIEAKDTASGARDALKASQRIVPAVPLAVQQATLVQLDGRFNLPVQPPADALADHGHARGGLQLALQPRLADGLPGVRDWFAAYPFSCLEQKASQAIGLRDTARWQGVVTQLPTYLDSDGLAHYFPPQGGSAPRGSDTLTAYLLAASHEAASLDRAFALPDAVRMQMEDGLIAFVEGRLQRAFWSPRADLDVRKLAALEALSRSGRAQGRMLASITIAPNQWPTHAVIDWLNILQRVADAPQREQRLAEAAQVLRARMATSGTKMVFSTERDDAWWWLMVNGDVNAARLLLAVMDDPAWKDDIGRLAAGFIARQQRGAWQTTTANLWGGLALEKFSARFETAPVTGVTRASLGDAQASVDWSQVAPAPRMDAGSAPPPGPGFGAPAAGALRGNTAFLPWPTSGAGTVDVTQQGTGRPWLTLQSLAAVPLKAPFDAGYRVAKTITPIEQAVAGKYSRGDVLRITLEVTAASDMTWVVLSDPIPGGATILGSGLGRDSQIATAGEQQRATGSPAFEERTFETYRSYYEFMPKGTARAVYTVRLNNVGDFALPPTRVEAMYAPEVFGALPNGRLKVESR